MLVYMGHGHDASFQDDRATVRPVDVAMTLSIGMCDQVLGADAT